MLFKSSFIFSVFVLATIEAAALHPLDSLTAKEYELTVAILEGDGRLTNTTRFPLISLIEPDKAAVKAFRAAGDDASAEDIGRKAFAILKEGASSYKADVDLIAESVTSFEPATGEGMVLLEEIFGAADLALGSKEMIDGLAARELTADDVYCLPLTAGSFGDENEVGRRLMKVPWFVLPTAANWHVKPVEGLFAFVDLNGPEVLEVVDTGNVPIPEDDGNYKGQDPMDVTVPEDAEYS